MAKRDLWEAMLERKRPLDIALVTDWMVGAAVALGCLAVVLALLATIGGE